MTWTQKYRLRHYLVDSIWIWPVAGMFLAMAVARVAYALDHSTGATIDLHPDAARTVLITLASTMFSLVVFVSSALLIALQLASALLTPRIIAIVFRDPVTKSAMTLFVFTFTLLMAVVLRIGNQVPLLTVKCADYSCVASLALFLYLIDHIGKLLRPNKALRIVALMGRAVIEDVYPRPFVAGHPAASQVPADGQQSCSIPAHRDGVILACDIEGVVKLARRSDCVIRMVPRVGDFIAKETPLFLIFGPVGRLTPEVLRGTVAIGSERSMEQDPRFAFRILVDIASKALSPAVNDPTTAVLAIDQIHHLLRTVGRRNLEDDRVVDETGRTRFFNTTPGWEDFVELAVTEIRQYGAQSVQVVRRMRAMLVSLMQILPPQRSIVLRKQLDLLDRAVARSFAEPEDRATAMVADSQGVGSGSGAGALDEGPIAATSPVGDTGS